MPHAEEIWTGGAILTMDPANPRAEALAVLGGRRAAVGSSGDIEALAGPGTKTRELHGRFVMPGLVESHNHALWGACRTLYDIYVGYDAGLATLLDAVRDRCRGNNPGEVVFGGPWRPAMRAEMGSDPKSLLDAISTDHAIVLHDTSLHLLWCNSRALELAGLRADAADIPGGVIERDPASGAPNGILAETACAPVRSLIKRSGAQMNDALDEAVRYFNSFGFTAFKEAMAFEEELRTYRAADIEGRLTLHAAAHIVHSSPMGNERVPFDEMDRLRKAFASDNLHLGFAKLFLDGVAPGHTASFIDPYTAASGYDVDAHDPDATLLIPPGELNAMLVELDRRGYTVKMHAVGDNAIRKGLDGIEAARKANGQSGLRHEIAHSNYVSDDDLGRFKALGAVAELSPKMWYPNAATPVQIAFLGEDRVRWNHRIGDLRKAGAEMIYGSDWPASAPDANPWTGLSGMLTRKNADPAYPGTLSPGQAVTLEDALPLFTVNGARSLRLDGETGSLAAGKWADFIVLESDITKLQAEEIAAVMPEATVWKGRPVYESSG